MMTPSTWRAAAASFALLGSAACSSGHGTDLFSESPGRAAFAIAGIDAVTSLEYAVRTSAGDLVSMETSRPTPGEPIAFVLELRAAVGYELTITARSAGGQTCTGTSRFDVTPFAQVDVAVELECSGQVSVTGDLRPACPLVAIRDTVVELEVGASLVLSTDVMGTPVAPLWTASGGELTASGGATRFTCTEPGTVSIGLSLPPGVDAAAEAGCSSVDSVDVTCAPAATTTDGDEAVTLQFAARVAEAAFACGNSYDGVGASGVTVEPLDFRLFVHDVRLLTSEGAEVPVTLDERAPWQALGTALLDFEDASGACLAGDAATNTTVTGRVPPGAYTGVAFRVGVPDALNHADPALQPAPLGAGAMSWGWLSGYKFLRAELGAEAGAQALHLGAVACSGDPTAGAVSCSRPNRASVTLTGFDPMSDRIAADIGALFADADLSEPSSCHSSGAPCEPSFASLGVDLATGQSTGVQTVFRVEH